MNRFHGLICVGVSALAAGCGGGGGGGSSAPVTYAEITSDNAQLIASEVVGTTIGVADVGGGNVFAASANGSADAASLAAASVMKKRLWTGAGPTASFTLPPLTESCLVDGTVTMSGTIASLDAPSSGDRISMDFNQCDDGDGEVWDGGMDLLVRTFAGDFDADQYLLGADAALDHFSITVPGQAAFVGNGDMRVVSDSRSPPLMTGSVSGALFTLRWDGTTRTLRNFSSEFSEDMSVVPNPFTEEHWGTLSSPLFSGRVDYDTVAILQGAGENPPVAGELLITGKDDATIRLTVLDATNLQLDIDLDGDTVVDETQAATWDTLEP